jgi:hypothetical protein
MSLVVDILQIVAKNIKLTSVKWYLKLPNRPVNSKDQFVKTRIRDYNAKFAKAHILDYYSSVQSVQTDPNINQREKIQALYMACVYGHVEIVKSLIRIAENNLECPFLIACKFGNLEIVKLLAKNISLTDDSGLVMTTRYNRSSEIFD